jgi:hypothetical protein
VAPEEKTQNGELLFSVENFFEEKKIDEENELDEMISSKFFEESKE